METKRMMTLSLGKLFDIETLPSYRRHRKAVRLCPLAQEQMPETAGEEESNAITRKASWRIVSTGNIAAFTSLVRRHSERGERRPH